MRIIIAFIFFCFLSSAAYAQLFIEPASELFTPPVKGEQKLKQELFELPAADYNHSFKAALPGDNYLLIDFAKMSYWPEKGVLKNIIEVAAKTINEVQDSFKSPLTVKKVDIHIPIKNNPLTVRLKEHNDGASMLILNHDQQNPLKLGMDTICVKKTFSIQTDDEGVDTRNEILYTLILKDLQQIEELQRNVALIEDISRTFDSVVQDQRSRWSKQDIWYHEMHVSYNPMEEKDKQLKKYRVPGFLKGYDYTAYVGASLFRNELAPNIEVGFGYKWPSKTTGNLEYVRFSMNTLETFERMAPAKYNIYSTLFVNLEAGSYISKKDTWIPIYQTSLGLGYMFSDEPWLRSYNGLRLFFNYSLSPSVRITPDFYYLFKKGLDPYSWVGLTVSLRIL